MKIPPIYEQSDVTIIVGCKDDYAALDIISPMLTEENFNADSANEIMHKLSVALVSIVAEEVENNRILKTQPFINLCRYMVYNYPELVLEDDVYALRKAVIRMEESINENEGADMIIDPFMEMYDEESGMKFQIQLLAVSEKEGFQSPNKIKIIRHEEE